ncbi:hypothetical protein Agub_g4114, partial [Astrephomene gubernaculifera]
HDYGGRLPYGNFGCGLRSTLLSVDQIGNLSDQQLKLYLKQVIETTRAEAEKTRDCIGTLGGRMSELEVKISTASDKHEALAHATHQQFEIVNGHIGEHTSQIQKLASDIAEMKKQLDQECSGTPSTQAMLLSKRCCMRGAHLIIGNIPANVPCETVWKDLLKFMQANGAAFDILAAEDLPCMRRTMTSTTMLAVGGASASWKALTLSSARLLWRMLAAARDHPIPSTRLPQQTNLSPPPPFSTTIRIASTRRQTAAASSSSRLPWSRDSSQHHSLSQLRRRRRWVQSTKQAPQPALGRGLQLWTWPVHPHMETSPRWLTTSEHWRQPRPLVPPTPPVLEAASCWTPALGSTLAGSRRGQRASNAEGVST